jgi:hypothetical protein
MQTRWPAVLTLGAGLALAACSSNGAQSPATSQNRKLPIGIGSDSTAGISTTSCEEATTGGSVIGTGTFTSGYPADVNPDVSDPYYLDVYVYDASGAQIGQGAQAYGTITPGDTWQVSADVNPGYVPARCTAVLYANTIYAG